MAVGSCGWIPPGGGPGLRRVRSSIKSLDPAPALWFDSLADCVWGPWAPAGRLDPVAGSRSGGARGASTFG